MPLLARLLTTTAKMALVPLSQIPTLTFLYKFNKLAPTSELKSSSTSKYNDKISLIRTDITKLEVDAIVNAANNSLLGGGGVDGAIHRAAGPQLLAECEELDGCETGDAKITGAYRLPSKKVIHAVGPVYSYTKRKGMHTTLLQSCYTKALDLANENDCKSIAFSALSTGVYGYPSDEAAETAIDAVKGWLEADVERAEKMERVIFCSFMEKDEKAYEEYIPQFFPPVIEAGSKDEDEAKGVDQEEERADKDDNPQLDLPDVPTKEPTEEGEPEAKKAKVEDETQTEVKKNM